MPVVARVGDTITWTNVGKGNHTVTAFGGATFDSGQLSPGQRWTLTSYSGATIDYRCTNMSWYDEGGTVSRPGTTA